MQKKPTTKQLKRRRIPFKFSFQGNKSWFYLDDEHDGIGCSFHQVQESGQQNVHGLPITKLLKALKACGYIWLLLCAIASPSYAAQVCTDAGEFQQFAMNYKAKSSEIDNLKKQISLYIKNAGNLKEQNGLLKSEIALLQEAVSEHKKLNASCELLIDEHKKVLADALAALDEATKESLVEKGIYIGTGFALGVAARGAWVKWVR